MTHPLQTRAMRNARAIVQRLYADMCAIRPNWGLLPDSLSRANYESQMERARRRYWRAFDRYEAMRKAALARGAMA